MQRGGSSRGQEDAGPGQTLGIPGQSADAQGSLTGLSGDTANERPESIGRGSKRSLTGRRRDGSTASKRSEQRQAAPNEKIPRPASAGRIQPTAQQARPKRKGFLGFLNCCAPPDEDQDIGLAETAQPAKTPSRTQPTRAQQPAQTKQQPQNVSTAGTSADDSKEIINEKPGHQEVMAAEPILPPPEADKPQVGDATSDKPVPSSDAPDVHPNAAVRPLEDPKLPLVPAEPATGPPLLDTSGNQRGDPSSSTSPQVQVQAPTPIVAQQDEDAMILDRTPEQAARDNDIEMSDSRPSLPLTGQDAAVVVEEEKQAHDQRGSSSMRNEDLPPPPPLQNRQEQGQDATAVSHETSLVSTPEQSQKWLLPPLRSEFRGRKCLVLDLDETLVHSSFKVSEVSRIVCLNHIADAVYRYCIKPT